VVRQAALFESCSEKYARNDRHSTAAAADIHFHLRDLDSIHVRLEAGLRFSTMHTSTRPLNGYPGRQSWFERLAVLGLLGVLHTVLFLAFARVTYHPAPSVQLPDALITAFIRPRIREAYEPVSVVDPSSLQLRLGARLTALLTAQPDFDFSVARNESAAMVAPTLQGDGQSGIQPYLQRAGLRRGEGATVVLRIEVLESGDPGRIEIDASSGSQQIDQAAVDYARIQHWYAGRANGAPRPMWVRWGVRLQG
jgi:TonB family protein